MNQTSGERLKIALKELKLAYKDLDELVGIPEQKVKNLATGIKIMSADIAISLEEKLGISSAWLLLNKGQMFDKQATALQKAYGDDDISRLTVPYYTDIKASAGHGYIADEDSEVDIINLPKDLVGKHYNLGRIEAIKVHGDSMTPTIKENDVVFICKKVNDIVDNKIYIINWNGEIYIKRIFKRKDTYIIKSDNPIYPQDEVKKDEITIVGRLIYNMTEL